MRREEADIKEYVPSPLRTEHIAFPAEMEEAVRLLSRNTHEVWSSQRLRDGWRYGEQRDDGQKLHPCLVPYEELDQTERGYDLEIVEQVIKGLISLGYEITRSQKEDKKGEQMR